MPDEWLLIAYTALDENLNVIQGEVLKHSPDADDIYDALPQYGDRIYRRTAQERRLYSMTQTVYPAQRYGNLLTRRSAV